MASELASMFPKLGSLGTSDHGSVVSINLFVALLCACIVIGHLLEENRWINESITALIIGLGVGVVILLISGGKSSHLLVFSEDLFFIYLLPPIIFNAGFQVKKKQFFVNFITIMLFGAIGTLISCAIISLGIIRNIVSITCFNVIKAHFVYWLDRFSARKLFCNCFILV
ncbi:PREDICTED: sodium/hydrogen exchanger 1-like [Nicotiana attenuata]|uniref:sodium/hydrogen exchanger 1-like n=1 Tax=Nicotiana attenuata TaxID=49451 RepID=UPI00090470E5|nr:PREDICTED: sodium/hydrogen exchanger 1-like [Nicotiana attenuata]XP_019229070.1 PREDICTED: sodium/hydrogen exchanger 1-like [Nicotiana attenuata]XP_019229071.1 PREDICTED: sodium/hydrogen exchanger 1-like [Nicotiana attenuata]XP_019229072.1 PREDICTED: sodium/hydrogen exchanger 1-like [Nicotiana attenuata]